MPYSSRRDYRLERSRTPLVLFFQLQIAKGSHQYVTSTTCVSIPDIAGRVILQACGKGVPRGGTRRLTGCKRHRCVDDVACLLSYMVVCYWRGYRGPSIGWLHTVKALGETWWPIDPLTTEDTFSSIIYVSSGASPLAGRLHPVHCLYVLVCDDRHLCVRGRAEVPHEPWNSSRR